MEEGRRDHPDLFHLRPAGKARIISVEKTRELIALLNRTSHQGGAKAAIIHEADRMRKEAANAFLKTLEEPPPGTYLLLLSTRPYSLLATIRSRCLVARVPSREESLGNEEWKNWIARYQDWIRLLLDRERIRLDRVGPLLEAYGLSSSLIGLINRMSDSACKDADDSSPPMEDKERDAMEAGIRRGVRTTLFGHLSDATRTVVTADELRGDLPKLGVKLARALSSLERNASLLEVNLKDEAAIENFHLSSLRIWTAK